MISFNLVVFLEDFHVQTKVILPDERYASPMEYYYKPNGGF